MAELNMLQAINESLHFEMARDERVVVLGEDVGHVGGVFRATEGLYEKFGEQRVTDMPLAEGVIAGSAVGLAMAGLVAEGETQIANVGTMREDFAELFSCLETVVNAKR